MGKNISAEIMSVVTEENASVFHGEINQPDAYNFVRLREGLFKKTGLTYITSYTMTKKKSCILPSMYTESEILVTPWKDDAFITKFQS